MSYYVALPLLLLAAIAQTAIAPSFPVFGVFPNLVLIVAVCWTVVRGQKEGMIVVPLGGLCLGLLDDQPLGAAMLAAAPIVLLSEVREARLTQSDFLLATVLVFLSSLVYEIVFLAVLWLSGESVTWWGSFQRLVLPTAIVNSLFAAPLYAVVTWASRDIRSARAL